MRTCRQCGREIATFKSDAKFSDGKVWARTGTRLGDIANIDPNRYFCTLRCAARFGVQAVAKATARGAK